MPKQTPPQKRLEMAEIGLKYDELKALRRIKRQEYEAQLEHDMEQARAEFALFLQHIFTRTNLPYKFTVTDLMKAMGTTDRNTVNKFLEDAKERNRNRYLEEYKVDALGMELVSTKHESTESWGDSWTAIVHDEANDTYYRAILRNLKNKYQWLEVDADNEPVEGAYYRPVKRPVDASAPQWLNWLDNNDEWLTELGER